LSSTNYDDDNEEDDDSDILVSEVLVGMMNKDIASGIDLGLTSKQKRINDPTPKMNIRHKQVIKSYLLI